MVYKKISSPEQVAAHIAKTLSIHLKKGERVLWLIPGGSSIAIAAQVSHLLAEQDLHNLRVTLTDERFGSVGHADSNWKQLAEAGLELPDAQLTPVLVDADRGETTRLFAANIKTLIQDANFKLGFFGMGADGHTAGILPGSAAVTSPDFAASYHAGEFERITITPMAIALLDEVVLYASGNEKRTALENLQTDLPLTEQPAQILKKVPVFTIFNDQLGDTL